LNPALLSVIKRDEIEVRVECHLRQTSNEPGVKALDFVDLVTVVVNRLGMSPSASPQPCHVQMPFLRYVVVLYAMP
jgi:hypothetical protein